MMPLNSLILAVALTLSGCTTVGVGKFPAPPAELMVPPNKHINLDETIGIISNSKKKLELSDIIDNARINFINGFEDDAKLESLQEWIREQIKIYNQSNPRKVDPKKPTDQ